MERADVVIIGGGVVGCSIAYHLLRRDRGLRVTLLERESMLGTGSTAKAAGGIRAQFTTEANIRLSQLSIPEYRAFEDATGYSVHFRQNGYLFLTATPSILESLRDGVALQRSFGVPSEIIGPRDAAQLVPGLRTDDLIGAAYCAEDGSAEPAAAVQGYSARARTWGAEIRFEQEVVGFRTTGGRVTGVRTPTDAFEAGTVVIAAGPYSAEIARLAGVDVPAQPFRRQVCVVARVPELDVELPLTTDTETGFNMHRTGRGDLLLGGTDKDTRPGFGLDVDMDGVERVLTAAARRIPSLMHAPLRRTYVGLRALTPDYHPILGRVEGVDGLVLACGDNGKGFMHAPAIGRLISEEILDGAATSLDPAPFRLGRFAGELHKEANLF
ncbi:MAG TPA: FAD-dependent oxidoreductase [bacterium]|nr:FAD-dependent oxidoreductase [bacterium]